MKIKEFVKKYKIISFLMAIIIIGFAAALILHYKNDPIANIKSFYRRNKAHLNVIVSYFAELKSDYDNIRFANMNMGGEVRIYVTNCPRIEIDCSSEDAYNTLLAFRNKYIDDDYFFFNSISADYDINENMIVELEVYGTKWPDGMMYYLAYCDDDYDFNEKKDSYDEVHRINSNWYIVGKQAYPGY